MLILLAIAIFSNASVTSRVDFLRTGIAHARLLNTSIYTRQQVSHAVVVRRQIRHVYEIRLIQIGDTFQVRSATWKTYSSGSV